MSKVLSRTKKTLSVSDKVLLVVMLIAIILSQGCTQKLGDDDEDFNDWDADSVSNTIEVTLGTDPNDPESRPFSIGRLKYQVELNEVGGEFNSAYLVADETNQQLYLFQPSQNRVHVFDTVDFELKITVDLNINPQESLLVSEQNRLYILNEQNANLMIMDTAENRITHTVPVGNGPWRLSINDDQSWLGIANSWGRSVSLVNLETFEVETLSVDSLVGGIVADGENFYFALSERDQVGRLSLNQDNEWVIEKFSSQQYPLEMISVEGVISVINQASDSVSLIAPDGRVTHLPFGYTDSWDRPFAVVQSQSGGQATVISESGLISLIDPEAGKLVNEWYVDERLKLSREAYSFLKDDEIFATITTENNLQIVFTEVDYQFAFNDVEDPISLASSDDQTTLYVLSGSNPTLSSYDVNDFGLVNNPNNDFDGDGVINRVDAFPRLPSESSDFDGDGIGDNADLDDDGDGLGDAQEIALGTNPLDLDSDDDGVDDLIDRYPLDETEQFDTDNDGIPNGQDPDDDNDGVPDEDDAFPLDETEQIDTDQDGVGNRADLDDDGDGLPDLEEVELGLPPLNGDADSDGLDDGVEVRLGLEPLTPNIDSDGDGLVDRLERQIGLDPSSRDSDQDGVEDGVEDLNRNGAVDINETDPKLADTDGDGLPDGLEFATLASGSRSSEESHSNGSEIVSPLDHLRSDPLMRDTDRDGIWDGFEDVNANGLLDPGETSPHLADTDGDGVLDGDTDLDGDGLTLEEENQLRSDPTSPDTDGDGVADPDDRFPLDPNESVDTDGDGVGDRRDALISDPSEVFDKDGDGIGDIRDTFDDRYLLSTVPAAPMISSSEMFLDQVTLNISPSSDGSGVEGYHVYRRHVIPQATITIDGEFDDWTGIPDLVTAYGFLEDPLQIKRVWLTYDQQNLYLKIELTDDVEYGGFARNGHPGQIYFDLDQMYETGFNRLGLPVGADMYLNMFSLHETAELGSSFHDHFFVFTEHTYFVNLNRYRANAQDLFDITEQIYNEVALQVGQSQRETMEMAIPLVQLGESAEELGLDLILRINQDVFPTINTGDLGPNFLPIGWSRLTEVPIAAGSWSDVIDHEWTYEYAVTAVSQEGIETALVDAAKANIDHPFSVVRDFNVRIIDASTLEATWVNPGADQFEEIILVRRNDRYPLNIEDGLLRYRGKESRFVDTGLRSGAIYYYSIFLIDSDGRVSRFSFKRADKSIPTHRRGKIPGIDSTSKFVTYFGAIIDEALIAQAKQTDLFVFAAGEHDVVITPEQVADIQSGVDGIPNTDDDVIVIAYITIGEDIRPSISPRLRGDNRIGPSYYDFVNQKITYQYGGVPSFYVDEIDNELALENNLNGRSFSPTAHDGLADPNVSFGGSFVNAGDSDWQDFLFSADTTSEDDDNFIGSDYLVHVLKVDGLFLDTVGNPDPRSYWTNFPGDYYWTWDGMLDLIGLLADRYPDVYITPNRPMHAYIEEFNPRIDDFRAFTNAMYWESMMADVNYIFPGIEAMEYLEIIQQVSNNDDQMGITVMPIDYEDIVLTGIDRGVPNGEGAPYLEVLSQYLDFCHYLDFACYMAKDRDLFDFYTAHGDLLDQRDGVFEPMTDFDTDGIPDLIDPDLDNDGYPNRPDQFPLDPTEVRDLDNDGIGDNADPDRDGDGILDEEDFSPDNPNPPASNAANIVIDGNLSDWAALSPLAEDSDDQSPGNGPDFAAVTIAHDDTHLFLRVTSHDLYNLDGSPIEGSAEAFFSHLYIFIDVDRNFETGFVPFGRTTIGSEFMLQGNVLYAQSSESFATGVVGFAEVQPTQAVMDLELSIDRTLFGNAESFRIFLGNDENGDTIPEQDAIEYQFPPAAADLVLRQEAEHETGGIDALNGGAVGAPFLPSRHSEITVDGLFTDWFDLTDSLSDGDDAVASNGPDFEDIMISHDDHNIYFKVKSYDHFNFDGSSSDSNDHFSRMLIFIDTDGVVTTGYAPFGVDDFGSEFMIQGTTLFRQGRDQFIEAAVGSVSVEPRIEVTELEISVSRSDLNNPSHIQVMFGNDENGDRVPETGGVRYRLPLPHAHSHTDGHSHVVDHSPIHEHPH